MVSELQIKVSHSLMTVGAVGIRVKLLGAVNERWTHPSPLAALSFPVSVKVPIYFWVDRVFLSSDGEAQPVTQDLPATFCTITKPL